ncbi:MAG: hypothetical protein KKA42_12925 [candidate division Zixibacteria bacterium]|nr:hypothetical protein [candidate division Zixibacteria bacterium]
MLKIGVMAVAVAILLFGTARNAVALDTGGSKTSDVSAEATIARDVAIAVTGFGGFLETADLDKSVSAELVTVPDTLWSFDDRDTSEIDIWQVTMRDVRIELSNPPHSFDGRDFVVYLSKNCDTLLLIESVRPGNECERPTIAEIKAGLGSIEYVSHMAIPTSTTLLDALDVPRGCIKYSPIVDVRCLMVKHAGKEARPMWSVHGFCIGSLLSTSRNTVCLVDAVTGEWILMGGL